MLFRDRSAFLFRHTVVLCALVVVLAAVVGVACAWCTERGGLPFRRVWTVLLVMPVAIPDFVVGYAWHSIDATLSPLFGATLVMTLGTYPLVYLPWRQRCAGPIRRWRTRRAVSVRDRSATFVRVTLPLIRHGTAGRLHARRPHRASRSTARSRSCATRRSRPRSSPSSSSMRRQPAALAIPLVGLGLLVLAVEGLVPRRQVARQSHRGARRLRGGAAGCMCRWLAGLLAVVGTRRRRTDRDVDLLDAAQPAHDTARDSDARRSHVDDGALQRVGCICGGRSRAAGRDDDLPALRRRHVWWSSAHVCHAGRAGRGHRAQHVSSSRRATSSALYQTGVLLVTAYAILHFPLALVCVQARRSRKPRFGSSTSAARLAAAPDASSCGSSCR